jgi:outer membrane protein insertion porin family
MSLIKNIGLLLVMMVSVNLNAQLLDSTRILVDFEKPVQYKIEQITISGNTYTPAGVILVTSGLKVGQTITIPGDDTKQAISKLWKRKLFSDIEIGLNKVKDGKISLHISVVERPALSKYSIKGLKKAETNNVRDEISLQTNQLITEDLINKTKSEILAYFYEKGFYGVKTSITRTQDPKKPNFQILRIEIDRGKKVRMQDLFFVGNENI